MWKIPRSRFGLVLIASLLLSSSAPDLAAQNVLLQDKALPSVEEFLEGPPVDWLILAGNKVLVVEPLSPRPGALEAFGIKLRAQLQTPEYRASANDTPEMAEAKRQLRLAAQRFPVTAVDGVLEMDLSFPQLREVIYWEDLLLRKTDELLKSGQTAEAAELLAALEDRDLHWPGAEARQERLLIVEGEAHERAERWDRALIAWEELRRRNPAAEDLSGRFAQAAEKLVGVAVAAEDYYQARHLLHRWRAGAPRHPGLVRWTEQLQAAAREQLRLALEAERTDQLAAAALAMDKAVQIWPRAAELVEPYQRIMTRYPRLTVGVVDLPHELPLTSWPNVADGRAESLTRIPLFEADRIEGGMARYRTAFFSGWEPTDLGRRIRLDLKTGPISGVNDTVSAAAIVEAIQRRMNPVEPHSDERLAANIAAITYHSPVSLSVDFKQAPLRPQAWFTFALEPAGETPGSSVPQRFLLQQRRTQAVIYQRALAATATAREMPLAEIQEQRYPSTAAALEALRRGEVLLVPAVTGHEAAAFQSAPEFVVRPYALPQTHLLQFRPQHPVLSNRTLRRALASAIRREAILEETVLGGPAGTRGRLTSAPVPRKSEAYNAAVAPRAYDLRQAMALMLAAREELGGSLPPLQISCPDDPLLRAAAEQIAADWQRLGLAVQVTRLADLRYDPNDPSAGAWDIQYRAVQLVEPLTELAPLLSLDPRARMTSLASLPHNLRQSLLNLDRAADWPSAQRLLHEIHQQLDAELPLIPLWEVEQFLVAHRRVSGLPPRLMSPYQGIEQWRVQPAYDKEQP